jgi:hypothetical protein
LELLKYRINTLADFVDYFVIVEATHTHAGVEKPLYFEKNMEMFKDYNDKIIHVIIRDMPHKHPNISFENREQWNNEHFQRDRIDRGLERIELTSHDILIVTDLDEIPDRNILKRIKTGELMINFSALEMDMYYYNLNTRFISKWDYAKILSFETYKRLNTNFSNMRLHHANRIEMGGWHLSYFGDNYFIQNKLKMFGHQEFNTVSFTDPELIKKRMDSQIDLFDRTDTDMEKVPVSLNFYLPYEYEKYLKQFILY